jgi:hypothetical protein
MGRGRLSKGDEVGGEVDKRMEREQLEKLFGRFSRFFLHFSKLK